MIKTFDIALEEQKPVDPHNSFVIYRGDNVAFNFSFFKNEEALEIPAGTTLRVFAKKIEKNGVDKLSLPLFAGDFTETNTATFNSSQTAGDAGNYILSVLLVSSDNAIITSQCIYFELKENGYAGYYQPSADYRDDVLNAKQEAINARNEAETFVEQASDFADNASASASNASESETNSYDFSEASRLHSENASISEENALYYSSQSESYKSQAEQFLNETITAKNEAILAKEQAREISDPENRIGNLQQTKSDRGEFWFRGGSLACANKWTNSPFSLALTFSMTPEEYDLNAPIATSDYQWLGTAVYGQNQKGFCLSLDVIGTDPRCVCIFYGATRTTTFAVENFKGKYCDGKPHSLFVILNSTTAIVQIDDDIYSANAPDYDGEINTKPFSIFKNTARFSRIKYFNFDMSDANAPYTIADYISGKDESPLLYGGAYNLNSQSDWLAFHSNEGTFASTGNDLTFTASEDATANYLVFYVNASVKAGAKVEALIDSVVNNSSATTSKYSISAGATATNDAGSSPSSNTLFGTQTSFTTTKDSNKLAFWIWKTGTFATGETLTLVNPQIRVNGALLSLDDYTFNGKVFDTSGNNNTATITGAVYGTKDNAVEQMYQAFASRIGNLT